MNNSFKIPIEQEDYDYCSQLVRKEISKIIQTAIEKGDNKIFIHTNLRRGLPLENINKVAGPFVEAWALEKFEKIAENPLNEYNLVNVEPGVRLAPYDIILQFKKKKSNASEVATANVDVKATSDDIPTSGRSPNITSFGRIRTEYINDPDYIFIILSLKHKVYGERNDKTGMTNGIMEVTTYSVYDLKYVDEKDISYNPALGTGQLQIRDIHYVSETKRTTWEFLQILDRKFIRSKGQSAWDKLAKIHGWLIGTEPKVEVTAEEVL
ncbi:MAG TPA: restriction endonuclease [Patescibacteria group bacterium]